MIYSPSILLILKASLFSCCKICGRKTPSAEKVYFTGVEKLGRELDVISLMRKLRIVDLLTSVVFSERKRILIPFVEKTYLSEGEHPNE